MPEKKDGLAGYIPLVASPLIDFPIEGRRALLNSNDTIAEAVGPDAQTESMAHPMEPASSPVQKVEEGIVPPQYVLECHCDSQGKWLFAANPSPAQAPPQAHES